MSETCPNLWCELIEVNGSQLSLGGSRSVTVKLRNSGTADSPVLTVSLWSSLPGSLNGKLRCLGSCSGIVGGCLSDAMPGAWDVPFGWTVSTFEALRGAVLLATIDVNGLPPAVGSLTCSVPSFSRRLEIAL